MADEYTDFNLEMDRGDGRTITITATYPEAIPAEGIAVGDPLPLGGKAVYFTAKASLVQDDDSGALFKKTTSDGITVRADPNDHICDIVLQEPDTEGVRVTKEFYCDCRVLDATVGSPWTVAKGMLKVRENVTRET